MSQEDEKELKDLVTQFLATNGFLRKIQAEIRAGVFLALEEQESFANHNTFINKKLKDFVNTPNGILIINLIREFLEFFNLEFTAMVFDPETHSGDDYKFEGRSKLADKLDVDNMNDSSPLIEIVLQSLKNGSDIFNRDTTNGSKNKKLDLDQSPLIKLDESGVENSKKSNVSLKNGDVDRNEKQLLDETFIYDTEDQDLNNTSNENKMVVGLLERLRGRPEQQVTMSDLNSLLTYQPDSGLASNEPHYEDDFASSSTDTKKNSHSLESEIEEDIPSQSNHSNEEVTVDVSVSRASGHADYSEDISV